MSSTPMEVVSSKKIGTHDGSFHCDEALACFMLQQTAEFSQAAIVRSRDPKVLDTLDIVVDVGAVYEPAKHRYDHHQRGFAETLSHKHTMKLSSAGLVYKSVHTQSHQARHLTVHSCMLIVA